MASEGSAPRIGPPWAGRLCQGQEARLTCQMTGESLLEQAMVCSALLPPDKHVTSGHIIPNDKPVGPVVIQTREKKREIQVTPPA